MIDALDKIGNLHASQATPTNLYNSNQAFRYLGGNPTWLTFASLPIHTKDMQVHSSNYWKLELTGLSSCHSHGQIILLIASSQTAVLKWLRYHR
jgi:hypothetical protein